MRRVRTPDFRVYELTSQAYFDNFFHIFCFEQHQTYFINVTYIGTPSFLMGIFDIEVMSFVRPKVTANFALIAGSSRHGKALLASVGWNWVTAIYLKGLINIISIYLPGSLHILVTWFFVFWLSRTTKIIFYVCLLTHFMRQDRQNVNLRNKQSHAT